MRQPIGRESHLDFRFHTFRNLLSSSNWSKSIVWKNCSSLLPNLLPTEAADKFLHWHCRHQFLISLIFRRPAFSFTCKYASDGKSCRSTRSGRRSPNYTQAMPSGSKKISFTKCSNIQSSQIRFQPNCQLYKMIKHPLKSSSFPVTSVSFTL